MKICAALLIGAIFWVRVSAVSSHNGSLQSWPTRTPTPQPETPSPEITPTAVSTVPNTEEPPSPATNPPPQPTRPGDPTQTATAPIIEVGPETATRSGQEESTAPAGPDATTTVCQGSPVAVAQGMTNVRSGPGTEYAIVATLSNGEMRLVLGRSAYSPWWQIMYSADTSGWVADRTVQIFNVANKINEVAAPPINGETPTPGITWLPTPDITCLPNITVQLDVNGVTPTVTNFEIIEGDDTGTRIVVVRSIPSGLPESPTPIDREQPAQDVGDEAQIEATRSETTELNGTNPTIWILTLGIIFVVGGSLLYVIQNRFQE